MSGITFERPGLLNKPHDGLPLVNSSRMAFMLYIGLTIMLFAGLFTGWFVLRGTHDEWPPAGSPSFELVNILPHTALLILSVFFMRFAEKRSKKADYPHLRQWVFYSLLASILFLFAFSLEWYRLISGGLTMDGVFGSIYYLVTGVFIAHYIGGVYAQTRFVRRNATVPLILKHNVGFSNSVSWHYLMLAIWGCIVYLMYYAK